MLKKMLDPAQSRQDVHTFETCSRVLVPEVNGTIRSCNTVSVFFRRGSNETYHTLRMSRVQGGRIYRSPRIPFPDLLSLQRYPFDDI